MKTYFTSQKDRALNMLTESVKDLIDATARHCLEMAIEKLIERRRIMDKILLGGFDIEMYARPEQRERIHSLRQILWAKYFEISNNINTLTDLQQQI